MNALQTYGVSLRQPWHERKAAAYAWRRARRRITWRHHRATMRATTLVTTYVVATMCVISMRHDACYAAQHRGISSGPALLAYVAATSSAWRGCSAASGIAKTGARDNSAHRASAAARNQRRHAARHSSFKRRSQKNTSPRHRITTAQRACARASYNACAHLGMTSWQHQSM